MSELNLEQNKYSIGDIGLGLILAAMIGLGWIATLYVLYPTYSFPILFTIATGIFGFVFAIGTGGLQFKANPVKISVIFLAFMGVIFFAAFGIISTFIKPQAAVGSIIITLPALIALMFFGFVGVLEEFFWRGIYIGVRNVYPSILVAILLMGFEFLGGIAFHQAVAFSLFQGTIFSSPGYFIWIGVSWVVYVLLLEATKSFSVNTLAHFVWNVGVTYQSLTALGLI
ncbi:MAG: CPBP family glutamic-type intramembrane protease [Patescibacteria group bacterium]